MFQLRILLATLVMIYVLAMVPDTITAENTTPHPAPKRFLCPEMFGRFTCRVDPKKYWLCVNFVPFLQHCPGDLFFDATLGDCKGTGHHKLVKEATTKSPKH